MNAEKHYGKSFSRTLQPKQGNGRVGLVDNRAETITQTKLIDIIQNKVNQPILQMKHYTKTGYKFEFYQVGKKIDDPWLINGETVNSDISKRSTNALRSLSAPPPKVCAGAHMIPRRIGGKGDSTNVRPWLAIFETKIWSEFEKTFDNKVKDQSKPDERITYTVDTDDMSEEEADNVIIKCVVDKGVKLYKSHSKDVTSDIPIKGNIRRYQGFEACKQGIINIPKKVKGEIDNNGEKITMESAKCSSFNEDYYQYKPAIPVSFESEPIDSSDPIPPESQQVDSSNPISPESQQVDSSNPISPESQQVDSSEYDFPDSSYATSPCLLI